MPQTDIFEQCTVQSVVAFMSFVGVTSMSMNCQTQLDLMACFPYFRDHYWYNAEPDFTIEILSSLHFNVTFYLILMRIWIFGDLVGRTLVVFRAYMGCLLFFIFAYFLMWSAIIGADYVPTNNEETDLANRLDYVQLCMRSGVLIV